ATCGARRRRRISSATATSALDPTAASSMEELCHHAQERVVLVRAALCSDRDADDQDHEKERAGDTADLGPVQSSLPRSIPTAPGSTLSTASRAAPPGTAPAAAQETPRSCRARPSAHCPSSAARPAGWWCARRSLPA